MRIIKSAAMLFYPRGILAQLGEHLPYKQRVIGSSPIGPILHKLDSVFCVKLMSAKCDKLLRN